MVRVDTIAKLVCPKCDEYNYLDLGDLEDMTVPDVAGCKCWNCQHAFDFEGDEIDPDDCDLGERLIEPTDEIIRDAESWRWIKEVVDKTGFIDFGGNITAPTGPGHGYEFCAPCDAKEYWSGTQWKPIGMASDIDKVDRNHRRKRRG